MVGAVSVSHCCHTLDVTRCRRPPELESSPSSPRLGSMEDPPGYMEPEPSPGGRCWSWGDLGGVRATEDNPVWIREKIYRVLYH